ncbi:hypothetical protein VNO80_19955 [Phaseolus coccineus]|uniref:Bifunctional inhibitor/plant lipid transfer protein/seed storage helical domain-containing protein n=1 Tax=Phaseolus coccineus TaxID=3886 RepID=A0AAN9MIG6_PHACN
MGSKGSVFVALFLSLNLLSLSVVTSQIFQTCSVDLSRLSACSGLLTGEPASPSECCNALVGMGVLEASFCVTDAILRGIMATNFPVGVSVNITLNQCGMGL